MNSIASSPMTQPRSHGPEVQCAAIGSNATATANAESR